MAAEPETRQPPPEPPIATDPSADAEPVEDPTTTEHLHEAEYTGAPPLAQKRRRRPSVRLGEIGDRRATGIDRGFHTRRMNMPPWSWRSSPKEPSRTISRGRSATNLANGGEEEPAEFSNKRGKSKRGSSTTTKRLRSHFAPKPGTAEIDGDEEAFRGFDHNHDQEHHHSPVHSTHENGYWHIGRHQDRARVSENDVVESDSMEGRKCEGVRSWLFELGLSRYAPLFEIHEVDDELLPMLTLEDLKDMGINAVGSRRKMYTAIQKLRKGFP